MLKKEQILEKDVQQKQLPSEPPIQLKFYEKKIYQPWNIQYSKTHIPLSKFKNIFGSGSESRKLPSVQIQKLPVPVTLPLITLPEPEPVSRPDVFTGQLLDILTTEIQGGGYFQLQTNIIQHKNILKDLKTLIDITSSNQSDSVYALF